MELPQAAAVCPRHLCHSAQSQAEPRHGGGSLVGLGGGGSAGTGRCETVLVGVTDDIHDAFDIDAIDSAFIRQTSVAHIKLVSFTSKQDHFKR